MKAFLQKVMAGQSLGESEASDAMTVVMEGQATPAQIGALLGAIAARGETEDEVVGFARAMRARAPRVRSSGAIDTCGTGGDGAGTFNISTLASLVRRLLRRARRQARQPLCQRPLRQRGRAGGAGG
jgi:anthranilate phosphoribosyltransferase